MNLKRVKGRVKKGGHAEESEKVEKRYFLTMELLIDMVKNGDETYLCNSCDMDKHILLNKFKF